MITLKDYLTAIDFKITGGSDYGWDCFGPNARYLDCEGETVNEYSVHAVFDSVDQTVYVVEAWDYRNDRFYRWISPYHLKAYKKACKKHDVDFKNAFDDTDFVDLDDSGDILEKASAIVAGEEYDTRVLVPLNLDKEELHKMMLLAHEADMTLNAYVEMVLQTVIDNDTRTADQDA